MTKLRRRAAQTAADLGMAWVLTAVAFGEASAYPAVLLAIKLNVFAVPLAVAGPLAFPWWVWYVIAVLWVAQWLYYLGATVGDVVAAARAWLPSTGALTDSTGPAGERAD